MRRGWVFLLQILVVGLGIASGGLWLRLYAAGLEMRVGQVRGLRASALPSLQRAVSLDPWWGEGWYALGRARMGIGDLEAAAECLGRATRTHWDYNLEASWGWCLEQQGLLEEAMEHYRRGLRYDPGDPILGERAVVTLRHLASLAMARTPGEARESVAYRGGVFDPPGLRRAEELLLEATRIAGERAELLAPVLAQRGTLALIMGNRAGARRLLTRQMVLDPLGFDPTPIRWLLEEEGDTDRELRLLRMELQTRRIEPEKARLLARELEARRPRLRGDPGELEYLLALARVRAGEGCSQELLEGIPPDSPYRSEAERLKGLEPGEAPHPGGGELQPLLVQP